MTRFQVLVVVLLGALALAAIMKLQGPGVTAVESSAVKSSSRVPDAETLRILQERDQREAERLRPREQTSKESETLDDRTLNPAERVDYCDRPNVRCIR
jgi:hypothetical protein